MKRIARLWVMVSAAVCMLSACTHAQSGQPPEVTEGPKTENILIIYLSRTNNTKAIAEIIQEQVGGTLVALELETPYPENYKAIVAQVHSENETGYLPPLKTKIANIQEYDTIFVGFPTWDMQLPPPMKSFLHNHDLSGKTVIPFNTNGGYGVGSSFETVKDLCPDANILKGLSMKGGLERDGILLAIKGDRRSEARTMVIEWLHSIRVL
ncbi:flavodoxin [Pontibacter sp. CAU 1760]